MLTMDFKLTDQQNHTIRLRCLGNRAGVSSTESMEDWMSESARGDLAMRGFTHIILTTGENVLVTLDDVTPVSVEYAGADDPALTRKQNRILLRRYIEIEARHEGSSETDVARRRHFKKFLRIFDSVAENAGRQASFGAQDAPPKERDFNSASEIVVGDTIQWSESVVVESDDGEKKRGWRTMVAEVIKESVRYLPIHRDVHLWVTRSFGDSPLPVGPMVVSEDSICDRVQRRKWKDEKARDTLSRKVHDRNAKRDTERAEQRERIAEANMNRSRDSGLSTFGSPSDSGTGFGKHTSTDFGKHEGTGFGL